MFNRLALIFRLGLVLSSLCVGVAVAQTPILTFHGDIGNTGANSTETTLTPSNVNTSSFSRRFSTTVDGKIYAEPLYMPNVNVVSGPNAGTHNLVFVATQHDTLFAIDAQSGLIIWQTSFTASGLPGAVITSVPSSDTNCADTSPEIGVCSTPVIDPSTNYLYAVAKTKQTVSGVYHYVYTLYQIDITNGNATPNANIVKSAIIANTIYNTTTATYTYNTATSPTAPQDPFVVGTGDGAITVNGQSRVYLNTLRQMNRPGLRLYNGTIYIAFASHGDNGPYHGWLLAYSTSNLALVGVLNTTPNAGLGGIWGGGGAPVIDSNGYIYVATGNGLFDGYNKSGATAGLNSLGFPVNGDYGDSFIKIAVDPTTSVGNQNINGWGLTVVDYFSPFNSASLDNSDTDLGSGGLILLPPAAGSSAHPNLLIGAGKQGNVYLVDTANMGKFSATTDNVVQEQVVIGECFTTPCFFNGVLYYAATTDYLKGLSVTNAQMSTSPSQSSDTFDWPGATLAVSANGTTSGIIWGIDNGSQALRAYQAGSVGTELWNSTQAANNTDALGVTQKFAAPTVADGQVFVPTSTALVVYGPPPAASTAPAAPTNLTATAVSGLQVNLSWTDNANNENGFSIQQSSDGVNFTQIGTVIANVTTYSVETTFAAGSTYYFRVCAFNGSNNSTDSSFSNVASVTTPGYPPSLNYSSGFAGSSGPLVYNGSATIVNSRARLTDGGVNEAGTVFSANPQSIANFTTTFTFQETSATANGFCFVMQNVANTAVGSSGSDQGYGGINNSAAVKFDIYNDANEGSDSTGLFTNGASPTVPAIDLTNSGITLSSGDVISATLSYDGTTLTETITDTVTGATVTESYTVNLVSTIGSGTAYVGFSGGTGSGTAIQDILTWSYSPLPTMAPAQPTNLTATVASGTQINLDWTSNSTNQAGFIIMRATGTGSFTQVGVTGSNVTTYSDSGLVPNTTYSYEVAATNNIGNSPYSNVASALVPIPPATPTGAQPTAITSTSIAMSWTNNATNATGYHIFRKMTTASNFMQIASLPPTAITYLDTGLTPGTSYDYHIQAYNIAGYSDFSGFTAVTLSNGVPPTVTTGIASSIGPTSVMLAGTTNPNGTDTSVSFQYGTTTSYGSTTSGQDEGSGLSSESFTLSVSGLNPSTVYHYRAVAGSSGGTVYGVDKTFRTTAQQSVGAAPNVYLSAAVAQIDYTVASDGLPTMVYIQYGTSMAYGSVSPSVRVSGSSVPANLFAILSGLSPGTTYDYQIVTQSSAGTVVSANQTFTTLPFQTTLVASVGVPLALASGGSYQYASFGSPVINDSGNVAFRGVLKTGAGVTAANNVGIWADDDSGNLQLIAQTGTVTAPGATAPFTALDDPVYNNNSAVAFIGTLKTGLGLATSATNIGVWSSSNGGLALVAQKGVQAPDCLTGITFSGFTQIALPDVNGVILLATLNVNALLGVTGASNTGIWAVDASNNLHLIVRTGQILNGKTITALSFLSTLAPVSGQSRSFAAGTGAVTFLATFSDRTTGIFQASPGSSITPVATTSSSAPGPNGAAFASFGYPAINGNGNNAFRAVLGIMPGITSSNNQGIWADDNSGSLRLVAQTGSSTAPGTTAPFATLTDPVYNDNNAVAFVGTLRTGSGFATTVTKTGVWSSASGSLSLVAQTGTQAPGCPGGANFSGFTQIVLPDQNGVALLGTLATNWALGIYHATDIGIWATDSSGNLQLIVRTGQTLNGKTVAALSFLPSVATVSGQSRNVALGTGNLAYFVTFSDGTTAIFTVTLP